MNNEEITLPKAIRKILISIISSATCVILLNLLDNKSVQNIFNEKNIKFFLLLFSIQIIVFYDKNIIKFIKKKIFRIIN